MCKRSSQHTAVEVIKDWNLDQTHRASSGDAFTGFIPLEWIGAILLEGSERFPDRPNPRLSHPKKTKTNRRAGRQPMSATLRSTPLIEVFEQLSSDFSE